MTINSKAPAAGSPQGVVERSKRVRAPLLALHRALIAAEKIEYERIHGRVKTSGQLLRLVAGDPWFAWLHPLSEAIVQLDEFLDESDAFEPEEALKILARVRGFITSAGEDSESGRRYQTALQRHPDVVIEHGRVTRAME